MTTRVGIVGARGHTGAELLTILDRHPELEVVYAGSRQREGQPVKEVDGLSYTNLTPGEVAALNLDGIFLALPNGVGGPFARALSQDTAIVDISADHRFDDEWVYGLTELSRDMLPGARRIANPGCYATAIQLAIAPFIDILEGVPVAFGVSGYSGAGNMPSDKNDPERLADNLMPYSLVGHIHEGEASRQLGTEVRFVPHVHPAFRGILVTVHIPLNREMSRNEAFEILSRAYAGEPLVEVADRVPELKDGTDLAGIILGGVEVSADGRNLVVVGAEDNLLKGAAVQAAQNMNLALGFDELAGIVV